MVFPKFSFERAIDAGQMSGSCPSFEEKTIPVTLGEPFIPQPRRRLGDYSLKVFELLHLALVTSCGPFLPVAREFGTRVVSIPSKTGKHIILDQNNLSQDFFFPPKSQTSVSSMRPAGFIKGISLRASFLLVRYNRTSASLDLCLP